MNGQAAVTGCVGRRREWRGAQLGHHAFSRMVYSALPDSQRRRTLASLAALMGPYALSGGEAGAVHTGPYTGQAH